MDYQSETYVSGSFHILYIQVSMTQDLVKLEVVISPKELCSLLLRFHDSCPDKRQFYDASYKTKACAFLLN